MDQELEAVMNSSPRLITTKTWAILIDFTHPSPTPVTTNFMEYMFDICTLYSLPPSIPYAAVLLLHHHCSEIPLQVSFSTQEWLVEHQLVWGEGVELHGGWVLSASRLACSDFRPWAGVFFGLQPVVHGVIIISSSNHLNENHCIYWFVLPLYILSSLLPFVFSILFLFLLAYVYTLYILQ